AGRVVVDAYTDPALVTGQVIDAVGDGLAQLLVGEVLGTHLLWLALGLPFLALILEIPEVFLLLGVHRDHGLLGLLECDHSAADELELGIAVGMRTALARLAVGLQAVAQFVKEQ